MNTHKKPGDGFLGIGFTLIALAVVLAIMGGSGGMMGFLILVGLVLIGVAYLKRGAVAAERR